MTEMQKILDKVMPLYLNSDLRYMCITIKEAWLLDTITLEERHFATQEIEAYLRHLGPYDTLEVSLTQARINSSKWHQEQIYHNWDERPMTSSILERWWITRALNYGLGLWEGLKIAEDVGDLTCTQVDIVKGAIEQLGREPTIQEMKDWATVRKSETN